MKDINMNTRTKMYIYDRQRKSVHFEKYTRCDSDPLNDVRFMYKGSEEILLETPDGFEPSGIYSTCNEGKFYVLFQGLTKFPLLYTSSATNAYAIQRLNIDSINYAESTDNEGRSRSFSTQLNFFNRRGDKRNILIEGKLIQDITPKSVVDNVVLTQGKRKLTLNNLL